MNVIKAFKRPLVVTGIAFVVALVVGIACTTVIHKGRARRVRSE